LYSGFTVPPPTKKKPNQRLSIKEKARELNRKGGKFLEEIKGKKSKAKGLGISKSRVLQRAGKIRA